MEDFGNGKDIYCDVFYDNLSEIESYLKHDNVHYTITRAESAEDEKQVMIPEGFLIALARYRPSIDELIVKYNYSLEACEMIVKEYIITPKSTILKKFNHALLDLVEDYNTATFSICEFRFLDNVESVEIFYIIGNKVGCSLKIDNKNRLNLVTGVDYDNLIWEICEKSENFLDVMAVLLEYDRVWEQNNQQQKLDNYNRLMKILYPLVGGERYMEFYRYNFGR